MSLTQAQRGFYAEQGYVVVEKMVSADTLAELRERIAAKVEAAEAGRPNEPGKVMLEPGAATATRPAVRKLSALAAEEPFFRAIAESPRIVDAVAQLTGAAERVFLYSDQVFLKPAFEGSEKPLHQDNSYFRVRPQEFGVTCWLAIDEATPENGCLRYIPGSHKLGLVKHRSIKNTPHLVPDVDFQLDEEVPAPVPAGGCVFHHLLTMHSSKANQSAHSRRAWALHYVNGAADPGKRPWEKMLRVR